MANSYLDANGVFLNLLGIADGAELERIEYEFTAVRAKTWMGYGLGFGFERLKAIHQHLMGDVYAWAGQTRIVPSRKQNPQTGGVSIFADPEKIEQDWCLLEVQIKDFLSADKRAFGPNRDALTDIFIEANRIHPFPEGNGRSLQIYTRDLAQEQGIAVDYSKVSRAEWNHACAVSGHYGRLFERMHFIPIPRDAAPIRAVFGKIANLT